MAITSNEYNIDGRSYRFYEKDGVYYPSVTTVTGYGSDMSWYDRWVERIGEEEAKRQSTFSANRGTIMHDTIEQSFKKGTTDWSAVTEDLDLSRFNKDEIECGRSLYEKFQQSEAKKLVKKPLLMEEPVHYWIKDHGGYGGRFDFLMEDIYGNIVLVDYKTSKKPKSRQYIDNYLIQLSAYWYAIYFTKGFKIDYAMDVIMNEQTQEVQMFHLTEKNEVMMWFDQFAKKVKKIYDEVITPTVEGKVFDKCSI